MKLSLPKVPPFAIARVEHYIESHIAAISILTILVGSLVAFISPHIIAWIPLYGLTSPNDIGDTFGGMTNPFISLVGVFLTFLAFYIQYKANERQSGELEKQKKAQEFRIVQDSIRAIKDDIRSLTYSKDGTTYIYSEAIWYFIQDSMNENATDAQILVPTYFQMSYVLTLFDPLIHEIEEMELDKKEKNRALQDIDRLFESSLNFILKVSDSQTANGKQMHAHLKKIIIPAKRIKIMLREKLNKYKESEKDLFTDAVSKSKGSNFIKQAKILTGKGTVTFYKNYDEYITAKPAVPATQDSYEKTFNTKEKIYQILITESVRLLTKLDFLDKIIINIPYNLTNHSVELERQIAQEYFKLDLAELQIDKNMWRDDFLGKFVYNSKELKKFVDKFVKTTGV
jgi:hypothetical protein